MGQVSLWKQYAQTLQHQNQSKNRERHILYTEMYTLRELLQEAEQHISSLKASLAIKNEQILQLEHKDSIHQQQAINMQSQIRELKLCKEVVDSQNQHFRNLLEEKEVQIDQLVNEVSRYQSQLDSRIDSETHDRAVKLAENYLKVESYAEQLKAENSGNLAYISKLQQETDWLKKVVNSLKCRVRGSLTHSSCANESVLTDRQIPSANQLIKQNNSLVQQMMQISRQKMQMYSSLKQGSQTERCRGTRKSATSANQLQIQSLRQKNKELVDSLRF